MVPRLLITVCSVSLLLGCEEESMLRNQEPCTDAVLGTVSEAVGHGHGAGLLMCEERRGGGTLFNLDALDHRHQVGYSPGEVSLILDGEFVGKDSSRVGNHTHWVSFNFEQAAYDH